MIINLFDSNFAHQTTNDGVYSIIHGKKPSHIKYVRNKPSHKGITIFTDSYIDASLISRIKSDCKVAWLVEPNSTHAKTVDSWANSVDIILTYDDYILNKYHNKAKLWNGGGGWIKSENIKIHEKNKLVAMIYSNKVGRHEGYAPRHEIAKLYGGQIDLFGSGCNRVIEFKEEGICDYMFTIVIENVRTNASNMFTEKLIDSMLVGTVPILWGCPNVGNYFNKNGIIQFNNANEIGDILPKLNKDLYNSMMPYIKENIEKAKQHEVAEDWLYKNVFRNFSY